MSKTKYKLRELGEYKNGANYPKGSYGAGDKIVNVKDLFRGRYVSYDGLDELKSGALKNKDIYLVEDGDLLFTRSSLVKSGAGMVAMIKDPKEDVLFCGFIIRYRPNQSKVYPLYLLYLLRSPNYRKLFTDGSAQTNISNINQDTLGNIEVDLPSLDEQKNIVKIIDLCDTKIELNQRINAELESMAKTLYDYWFVQFDFPNEKGKPYKSAGGKMVWNEELKRKIPKDWKVESIEECCDIVDCLHAKKPDYEFEDENSYLLQLENIRDDGLLDLSNKYFVPKNEYQKWISRIEVTEDDILITNAGRVAATAQVPKGVKTGIGRNITAIRPKSINPTYLFLFFRSFDMKRQVKWNMDAGAFFSSLNVKGIKKLFIIRPSGDIEEKFENIVKPMRRKREELTKESQTLTELRDWLLPMLMNGQVKV